MLWLRLLQLWQGMWWKKARVEVDLPRLGVENVAPSVALPELSLSLSQCKKARVEVDLPHLGVENVAPSVALPELSSGSGKTTTFKFSFVVN